MTRFGVALCTYNGTRYLREQLESIAAQTRPPDLVVACDDASNDGTVAQVEAWAVRVPFEVRIVRNPANLGYRRNFEQAIAQCDADLIALSDQDDAWHPEKLASLESAFADPQAAGAFSDAEIVDEALRPLGYGLFDAMGVTEKERRLADAGRLLAVLLRRNIVAGAVFAFRGAWKNKLLPIPEGAVHDEWIALTIAAHGGLRLVQERLIRYRQHGGNQFGARRKSVGERWRRLQTSPRAETERLLALMRELRRRIGAESSSSQSVPEVEGKIAHLQRRVSLGSARLLRLPPVLAELASGRYDRYSPGWREAVRDLVSPM